MGSLTSYIDDLIREKENERFLNHVAQKVLEIKPGSEAFLRLKDAVRLGYIKIDDLPPIKTDELFKKEG